MPSGSKEAFAIRSGEQWPPLTTLMGSGPTATKHNKRPAAGKHGPGENRESKREDTLAGDWAGDPAGEAEENNMHRGCVRCLFFSFLFVQTSSQNEMHARPKPSPNSQWTSGITFPHMVVPDLY